MNTDPIPTEAPARLAPRAHDASPPGRAALVLEVRRGRTAQPLRPVVTPRFLIGNGPGCDLRLNGGDMPPLHCLLVCEEGGVRLEAVAPAPPLVINGRPVDSAPLDHGDEIEIGPFQILVHRPHVLATETQPHAAVLLRDGEWPILSDGPTADPADLSAAELVARIEAEEDLIERFERRRRTGAESLLATALAHAASRRADITAGHRSEPAASGHEPSDSLDVVSVLPLVRSRQDASAQSGPADPDRTSDERIPLSFELHRRLDRIARHEAEQMAAGAALLDAQQRLLRQLDAALQAAPRAHDTGPHRKAA